MGIDVSYNNCCCNDKTVDNTVSPIDILYQDDKSRVFTPINHL